MTALALTDDDGRVRRLGDWPATPEWWERGAVEVDDPVDRFPAEPWPGAQLYVVARRLVWQDQRPIEEQRACQIELLRRARDAHIGAGFAWDGSVFDSDALSQQRLLGALVAAQAGGLSSTTWRLADNSWRALSAADLAAAYAALATHTQEAFATFAALEAAVLAATTSAAVRSITWPPET